MRLKGGETYPGCLLFAEQQHKPKAFNDLSVEALVCYDGVICFQVTAEHAKNISHLESVEKAYLELLQRSEQMKVGIGNYKVSDHWLLNLSAKLNNDISACMT